MELQIYNPTNDGFVKNIEWNHEEIKKELSEKVEYYKNLVYTEEQIKDAKTDRAELNKFVTALEDKRKEIKKLCLAPYEDFEKKMKELVAIVNEPIKLIDAQVKGYEEQKKQEKLEEINTYFNECEKPEWLTFEQIFDAKWLNASVSIKSVKEAIGVALNKISSDSVTLQMLPVFGFEAMEVYKTTLDVNKSISEANRMAEVARKRAEYEAEQVKKAEEVCQSVVEEKTEENVEETEEDFIPDFSQPTKKWYEFKALLSPEDAQALAALFATRNIEYHQI